ncbi:MAG: RNA-binding S4 domain-containing protein [Novosphingobium sp.]|nr:RNA-binding S4 domain-containing protein [Novosphingobium sp.]
MRIDKLLWFLRFARSRTVAQSMVLAGHIRLNGKRIDKAHQAVAAGDVLTLPLPRRVLVVEVLALPVRRGPATEAQSCYRVLDEAGANP